MPRWLHNHLDKEKACQVVLQTPYGITRTSFVALHPDWKHDHKNKLVRANAQHYRVQADETGTSIGEAIRQWYGIPKGKDFERIDVEAAIHPDGHFILIPTAVTMRGSGRAQDSGKSDLPAFISSRLSKQILEESNCGLSQGVQ